MKHHASWQDMAAYYLYRIPQIISQTVAVAVLLASTITLSTMSRYNEISAMNAAGISIYRIITPILALALLISAAIWAGNEKLLPLTNKRMEYIKRIKIRKETPRSLFKDGRIWFRGEEGVFYNIRYMSPQQDFLQEVTVYYFDGYFRLIKRIDAAAAKWVNDRWVFEKGTVYKFPPNAIPQSEAFESKPVELNEMPSDFKQIESNPESMNYQELHDYIQNLRNKGHEVISYLVDLYAKQAIPFISLIMALIGTPFALRHERRGGKALGVALTLGIGFAYWVVLAMGLALGRGGVIPPFLAAWGANLLFAGLGFYLLAELSL